MTNRRTFMFQIQLRHKVKGRPKGRPHFAYYRSTTCPSPSNARQSNQLFSASHTGHMNLVCPTVSGGRRKRRDPITFRMQLPSPLFRQSKTVFKKIKSDLKRG